MFRAKPFPTARQALDNHPHCRQAEQPLYAHRFDAILSHGEYPRKKYMSTDKNTRFISTLHRGQRKLLMSEIGALLLLDPKKRYSVVYAGAAPGIHIALLSELFPNITVFHLYDPAPFKIAESEKIKLHSQFFTDDTAQECATSLSGDTIFICDIRRSNDERLVWEDMLAQRKWHEIIHPCLTSLKFRLPWPGNGVVDASNKVEYLDGDIHLPIWGPCNTTESRLVIQANRHSGTRTYDCLVYEEEMCHFNRVTRSSIHGKGNGRDMDGCYDCSAELRLLQQYENVWGRVISSEMISKSLGRGL